MGYVDGFVVAVPTINKEAYRKFAADAAPLFRKFGVARMVETWGDDVPHGEVTDFYRAVKAKDDETTLFSWLEYPSRAVRDASNQKCMTDPDMPGPGSETPFDGKRMIYGGFEVIGDVGGKATGESVYIDGSLLAVPLANKDAYRRYCDASGPAIIEAGAARVVETWGDDTPDGEVTDFRRAVNAAADEAVVFCWIEWPSKEARDAGWEKLMTDPRLRPEGDAPLYEGRRRVFGGFRPILDV